MRPQEEIRKVKEIKKIKAKIPGKPTRFFFFILGLSHIDSDFEKYHIKNMKRHFIFSLIFVSCLAVSCKKEEPAKVEVKPVVEKAEPVVKKAETVVEKAESEVEFDFNQDISE